MVNNDKQTDLAGNKIDVRETEEIKKAKIFVADHFKARVSESQNKKFEKWDAGKKRKWLKRAMRVASKDGEPSGAQFEADFKALHGAIFP